MALARFYVSDIPSQGVLWLDEAESRHAAKALRVQIGDDVLVFDGRGYEGFGTVSEIAKRSVAIEISGKRFLPRDHEGRLWVAIAMPKGDRQKSVIEKLVELGVDALVPIETERSVAKLDASGIARLERYGIEAAKQCQRNRVMQILPSVPFKHWIADDTSVDNSSGNTERWLVHPDPHAVTMLEFIRQTDHSQRATGIAPGIIDEETIRLQFAIGPEGGFTSQEVVSAVDAGFRVLGLGDRILRVETAVAAVGVLGSLRWTGRSAKH